MFLPLSPPLGPACPQWVVEGNVQCLVVSLDPAGEGEEVGRAGEAH